MLQEVKEQLASMNAEITACIGNVDNAESLLKLSELLEKDLTDDLVQFYGEFLGNQGTPLGNFAYGVSFHSAQYCLSRAESQAETDVDGFTPTDRFEFVTPEIDGSYAFNKSRVEIGSDRGTYSLCTDYAPTKHGCVGQLIMLDFNNLSAFVVAESITDLIRQFSEDLGYGRYKLKTFEPNEYWLEPDSEIDLGRWHVSPSRWSQLPL